MFPDIASLLAAMFEMSTLYKCSGGVEAANSAMESKRCFCLLALLNLAIFFQLFTYTTSSSSNISENDLSILLSFRSFITKDPSSALSSWNADGNSTSHGFCGWTGVTCSGQQTSGRHVTALRLRGLGLIGTMSPQLGNLTHLRVLDLSDNKLEGNIPPALANSLVLQELNLSTNFLTGTIPPSMSHLSKLVVFNIDQNNISGLVPSSFANLTAISVFSVYDNYVRGKIPPWLGNLTRLTYLSFSTNMMSGHVPPALSKLAYLEKLVIRSNNLEGSIHPSLFNMSHLEVFNVGSNQLSGSLPPDLGFTLPNLRVFSVYYNSFEGQIPASLANISLLDWYVLHGNRFRGRIPPNPGVNGRLKTFEVGKNELQATEPRDWDFLTSLVNCSNLLDFNIQLNNLSGVLPSAIGNLSQELQYLYMGGNKISGHIPAGIGRYYKLTTLELSDNLFTGTIPSDIGKLYNLYSLSLFQNRLHGEIPSSLGNITQVNLFDLSTNHLEGRIPTTLGNLSMLHAFDISNNILSSPIPQEIITISSLTQMFDLSNNALTGHIPQQIGQLVNIGKIDLSSNRLSGYIPRQLGNCLTLQFLYLQDNFLEGQIPEDLSMLQGLQVLDLSANKLSGPIPELLESFKGQTMLNLSFNQLSGPVPNKGVFTNASAVSLTGNIALCGGPLFLHLPACQTVSPNSLARHPLLNKLIISIVGGIFFILVCISACYYVKRLRTNQVSANLDQGNTFPSEIYQRISYAELYVATNSFSAQNLIGRGNFSSVYKGTLASEEHSSVAVKVLDLRQQGSSASFVSECNILKSVRHRKLVKVITVCDSLDHNGDQFRALVLQFISNGSLDKWLHPTTENSNENNLGMLSLVRRLSIALDVAEALEYIHHHTYPSIVHCDIKPSNILLDDDMTAHVGDFGLAKVMSVEASGQSVAEGISAGIKGTIGYVAPEYGMGTKISTEGDVFSYGVLLLEILTGRRPTDTSIHDATSLPKFVEKSCPNKLLELMDNKMPRNGMNTQEIIDFFIAPVSKLGLACCRDSPMQRMNMGEVVKELSAIKKAYESRFNQIQVPSVQAPVTTPLI